MLHRSPVIIVNDLTAAPVAPVAACSLQLTMAPTMQLRKEITSTRCESIIDEG